MTEQEYIIKVLEIMQEKLEEDNTKDKNNIDKTDKEQK